MIKQVLSGLFAASLCCAAAQAQDIGGRYRVQGTSADGSKYSGTAEIVATTRNTCRIVWKVGTTSTGICMRNTNAFTAAYILEGKMGLVIYEIKEDGTMVGLWTIADQTGVGTETLIPMR